MWLEEYNDSVKEPVLAKRIYVGSLPYSVTETQLEDLFSPYGLINQVDVITDKYTGQAKGFAFVEMANDDEAEKAIQALNGTELGGRTLVVNEARARESSGARPGRSGGFGNRSGGGGRRSGGRW
jgi:RNA recognition motif-containing protein